MHQKEKGEKTEKANTKLGRVQALKQEIATTGQLPQQAQSAAEELERANEKENLFTKNKRERKRREERSCASGTRRRNGGAQLGAW